MPPMHEARSRTSYETLGHTHICHWHPLGVRPGCAHGPTSSVTVTASLVRRAVSPLGMMSALPLGVAAGPPGRWGGVPAAPWLLPWGRAAGRDEQRVGSSGGTSTHGARVLPSL